MFRFFIILIRTSKAFRMTRFFRVIFMKKFYQISIACLFVGTILFLWFRNPLINDIDRDMRLSKINDFIRTHASNLSCKQPELPIYSEEMMKFVHHVPDIDCSRAGSDWVKCLGSECVIEEAAKIKHGPIRCSFTDVFRVDDFQLTDGKTTLSDDNYKLEKSDVVRVACKAPEKKWGGTLTGIRMDTQIWDSTTFDGLDENALKMNVLMFGFDSMSRNSFIRKLPKSYKYLTDTLKTIVLEGYNIVGDGTPQALIPILTGKTELELPDTRKRLKNTKFVDSYPFIWNDFKDAAYVTGFFEDLPQTGTFTYRLNGFKEAPTDHYMRSYYLANLGEQNKWPKLCTGEIPRHKVMFNAINDFFTVYRTKPMFLFAFHGELSHDDYNLVEAADNDLVDLLKNLNSSGALSNTILIIMSDHGHRFAKIRNTVQGKLEERLPFFSFTFPQWFKEKHKQAYRNFKENKDKLVTPFDIHATLKSVLSLKNTGEADISQRSVSLFSKIPAARSCADAHIEPHWCACLDWRNVPISNPVVEHLGETLVETLNKLTQPFRDRCALLAISRIEWALCLNPNKNVLRYKSAADYDGFIGDFSEKMASDRDTYQIKAILVPGNSIFEASFTHYIADDRYELKMSDISRVNLYGKQARCVENELPQLRKYCYCTKD